VGNHITEAEYNNKNIANPWLNVMWDNVVKEKKYNQLPTFYNKILSTQHEKISYILNENCIDNYAVSFNKFLQQYPPLIFKQYMKQGYTFEFNLVRRFDFNDRFSEVELFENKKIKYLLLLSVAGETGHTISFLDSHVSVPLGVGDLLIIPNTEQFNFSVQTKSLFHDVFLLFGYLVFNETLFCKENTKIWVPMVGEIEDNEALYKKVYVKIFKGEGLTHTYEKVKSISDNIIITFEDFKKNFSELFEEIKEEE
jgi:hypothetical protein